jgi:lipopolysaccharide transport system permease protein
MLVWQKERARSKQPPMTQRNASAPILIDRNEQFRRALSDLGHGLEQWRLWVSLGWREIRQRYRRSLLGPFWLTLTMAALIGGLGFTYSGLFGQPAGSYIPYIALGFITWGLISAILNDSCDCFILSAGQIKQIPVPLSIYVYKMLWKNIVIFAHNLVIYVGIVFIFDLWPGTVNLILGLLGVVFICVNGVWTGIVLGMISTRFRDVPQIVNSLVQVIFFLTPIFWHPGQLPNRSIIVEYNPLRYYLDIVRLPLLAEPVPSYYWVIVLVLTAIGLALALAIFTKFRRRVAYWL